MTRQTLWRPIAAALLIVVAIVALRGMTLGAALQEASPTASSSCNAASPLPSTPMAGMEEMGTPMAKADTSETAMEFDQLYVDMMVPHHQSIVAMSQAALPRLTDERLIAIAEGIVRTQSAEVEALRGYREAWYGSPDPMPMDTRNMVAMSAAMPGMGAMDDMAFQMDAGAQVAAICAAEDADLAFLDLTIPHHEMAIVASETAVEQATHEELRVFAQRVIDDQQREIDELAAIRADLSGEATPTT